MECSTLEDGMSIEELRGLPNDKLWMLYRDHLCLMHLLNNNSTPHVAELICRKWMRDYGYRLVMFND